MALKRLAPIVQPPIANVIVVEGSKREYRYFEQAALNSPGPEHWTVIAAGGGDPKSLLSAIRGELPDADRVFAVFDGDRRPPWCSLGEERAWHELDEFVATNSAEIQLIASLPCIEVWFLWHFVESVAYVAPSQTGLSVSQSSPLKDQLRKLVPTLDKYPNEDWSLLKPHLRLACQRARKARTAGALPAVRSDVDLLIRAMRLN